MSIYKLQREQVRRSIMDTAIAVFRAKGYEQASIDEITKQVGIGKGTFYNFYNSKGEILLAWAAEKFEGLPVEQALDARFSLEHNLGKFVDSLLDNIEQDEQLFLSFLQELLKVSGDERDDGQFELKDVYRQIIENSSSAEGVTAELLDIKIEVLNSSLFMGMVNWFNSGKSVEGLREHLGKISRVCLYGLLDEFGSVCND